MLACLHPILKFLGLASSSDLEALTAKAAELRTEISAHSQRLDAMLDAAYGDAPVIRIHHGTPPHLH